MTLPENVLIEDREGLESSNEMADEEAEEH